MAIKSFGNALATFKYRFGQTGNRASRPYDESFSATGGTTTAAGISPGNGYTYHVFTTSGTFTVTSGSRNIEYLVIGGGGHGGGYYGGGGGAGGLRSNDPNGGPGGPSPVREPDYPIIPGTYPVVVGSGGVEPTFQPGNYSSFNDTNVNSLGTIRSEGGGGGSQGGGTTSPAGQPGGSGSGGGAGPGTQALGTGNRQAGTSTPVPNQGFPGGQGGSPSGQYNSGGGGGAGGAGYAGDPNTLTNGSFGGPGRACPAFAAPLISPEIPAPVQSRFNTDVGPTGLYAGGGGANRGNLGSYGDRAGPGGGGGIGKPGEPGCDYTGGGGGGASLNPANTAPYVGGDGGSGIVIIRYLA